MAQEQFNHGARVLEVSDGRRPVRTVESAVIGMVATAPDSEGEVAASAIFGSGTNQLTFTAVEAGTGGNAISVRLKHPGTASATLAVSVVDKAITISLATDNTGALTSTAASIKTAVEAAPAADDLVAVVSGGTGVVSASATVRLAGGLDEAFPLNTPVLIAGKEAKISRLGDTGTAAMYLDDIMDQVGAVVVLVRVAEDADPADQKTNVIAGIEKLLDAESILGGVRPRLLVAPEFSKEKTVADALISVADKLRAFAFADGPNTTDADAMNYALQFGSERLAIIDPWLVKDGVDHAPSATWAAIAAKTDAELGFWWSPSNKVILGFDRTSRPVSYREGDPTCTANILNAANVTTIINLQGMTIWGNRTTSADPKWAFVSVRRSGDLINDSIARAHKWAVDRRLHRTYFADVAESVNAYLSVLQNLGAILGGECWADPQDNTPATIAQGKARFKFDWTPAYPAEDVVFESILVETYVSNLFPRQ